MQHYCGNEKDISSTSVDNIKFFGNWFYQATFPQATYENSSRPTFLATFLVTLEGVLWFEFA